MSFETLAHWARNVRTKCEIRNGAPIFPVIGLMKESSLLIPLAKGNLHVRVGIAPYMIPTLAGRLVW